MQFYQPKLSNKHHCLVGPAASEHVQFSAVTEPLQLCSTHTDKCSLMTLTCQMQPAYKMCMQVDQRQQDKLSALTVLLCCCAGGRHRRGRGSDCYTQEASPLFWHTVEVAEGLPSCDVLPPFCSSRHPIEANGTECGESLHFMPHSVCQKLSMSTIFTYIFAKHPVPKEHSCLLYATVLRDMCVIRLTWLGYACLLSMSVARGAFYSRFLHVSAYTTGGCLFLLVVTCVASAAVWNA